VLTRRGVLVAGSGIGCAGLLTACGLLRPSDRDARRPRIGYLGACPVPFVSGAFQQGLRDHGYREGENITVEFRFSEGHDELFVDMARELVGLEVDVMVASNTAGLQAAVLATRTIPIVTVGDQLALGMADNLARPRSNVTGPSNLAPTVARRWPPFPPAWHGRQRPAGAIRQHLSR
jgi:hypothetical protein